MDPEKIAAQIAAARRDFDYRIDESTCTCSSCISNLKGLASSYFQLTEILLQQFSELGQRVAVIAKAGAVTALALPSLDERLKNLEGPQSD